MEKMQAALGKLMLIGVIICILIVGYGGTWFLLEYGSQPVSQYEYSEKLTHLPLLTLTPQGVIQWGLIALVLMQVLRVMLTIWYFLKLKDWIFVAISLFILAVIIYSIA